MVREICQLAPLIRDFSEKFFKSISFWEQEGTFENIKKIGV